MHAQPPENATVAVYGSLAEVMAVVHHLRRLGFASDRISVAGRGRKNGREMWGWYGGGGRAHLCGAIAQTFWGELLEMLSDWAFFCFPDIGPVLVAGPLSGWIVSGLENSAIFGGLSAFGAGLYSIGIPSGPIAEYEAALVAGRYLLLAHGSACETAQARGVLMSALAAAKQL